MQAALLNAEKLAIASQLGASLAHEINNPLQSVIGCLGLAGRSLVERADVTRYLQIAREELRHVAGIVAQFRELHRISKPEHKSHRSQPQGLGLGLYITHQIVEAPGGRIDVSSRLGEETTFSV